MITFKQKSFALFDSNSSKYYYNTSQSPNKGGYTKYDDVDRLREMTDSDILAEKKREVPSFTSAVLPKAVAGGLIGAVGLGTARAIRKATSSNAAGNRWNTFWKSGRTGARRGALLGALALGTMAYKQREKERDDNEFYNSRLNYAQYQARRREHKDWKQNMTSRREHYTFGYDN